MRIVNCMRHANVGRGQLITHRFVTGTSRARACASFAFDGRGPWRVELMKSQVRNRKSNTTKSIAGHLNCRL